MSIENIPLNRLQVSPINVRKTPTQSIADLIASIRSVGLLNPLTVNPGDDGIYYVVAGSRRLAALKEVFEPDQAVPCTVLDASETDVFEASLAENVVREAMHPADQFDAFKKMLDAGYPVDDVAARFGVTSLMVRQRMKLANVSPKVLAEYRAGNATLEQIQALAISDDHTRQEEVWFDGNDWSRRPEMLRRNLTENELGTDDYRVEFVGLEAYEAAGGVVTRDLFGEDTFVADVALLDRLATEKLADWGERIKAEGWAWVEVRTSMEWDERRQFESVGEPAERPLDAEEQAEFNALSQRERELDSLIDDYDWDAEDGEGTDDLEAERDKVTARMEEIRDACKVWSPELMAKSGVLIYLHRHSGLEIERGVLKPGEKVSKTGKVEQTKPVKDHSKLPESATDKLYGDMTVMLRNGLTETQALAALAATLWSDLEYGFDNVPVHLGQKHTYISPAMREAMTDDDNEGMLERWAKSLKPHKGKLFEYFCKSPEVAIRVLACISIRHLSARDDAVAFAARAGINLADQWEVTTEWLAAQPKGYIIAALKEVKAKTDGLDKLKASELAIKAHPILTSKGWKPAPIRAPVTKKPDRKKAAANDRDDD